MAMQKVIEKELLTITEYPLSRFVRSGGESRDIRFI